MLISALSRGGRSSYYCRLATDRKFYCSEVALSSLRSLNGGLGVLGERKLIQIRQYLTYSKNMELFI